MEKAKTSKNKVRLVSSFTTLLLLVTVVICLFVVLQSLSKGYVELFGTSVFRVVTGSMEPQIPVGSILIAQSEDADSIEENDVVCFISRETGTQGMIVTHRIIGVFEAPDGNTLLQTKGDANLSPDRLYVTDENLIGRVIWHTGDGSTMAAIVQFLTGQYGFLACVLLPVILVAVWIFHDAAKSLRKEIVNVQKQLANEQKQQETAVLSDEEYAQLYREIESEIRKEMEQHADVLERCEGEIVCDQNSSESSDAVPQENSL